MADWNSSPLNNKIQHTGPGVYKIRLFENNVPVTISRLGGDDDGGILSIGQSSRLNQRRKQFIRSSNGKRGHSGGITWWLINRFANIDGELRMDFQELDDKAKAKEREEEEIVKYFIKFSEVPPLNGVIPNRLNWFDELRK